MKRSPVVITPNRRDRIKARLKAFMIIRNRQLSLGHIKSAEMTMKTIDSLEKWL